MSGETQSVVATLLGALALVAGVAIFGYELIVRGSLSLVGVGTAVVGAAVLWWGQEGDG